VTGRARARQLGGAAAVGGLGTIWGLGLARLLAEGTLLTPFYTSSLVVAATAIACGGLVLTLWRVSSSTSGPLVVGQWASFLPLALPLLYVLGGVSDPLAGGALLSGGAGLALLMGWRDRPSWLLPALLGMVTLCLYLCTLLPSVGEADTLEFQVVAAKLGVAHPTGYPLYVLLGKLFTLLPLKNVAWRVNLASAVFGAAAVVLLYGTVNRLTERPLISSLAALAFAFSATFWSQALAAEVYTLHNLLVVAILALLLRQLDPAEDRVSWDARGISSPGARVRRWHVVSFLVGLSLTNHLTTVLLMPAVALALLMNRPWSQTRWKARAWLAAAGLFLLGLSLYLFIPLRWPALNDGRWMTLGELLRYVTGGQFHGALHLDGWQDPARWRIVGRLLRQPFGWAGLALAAIGVTHLVIRRRRALAVTGVTFLAYLVYGLVYYVADIAVFLLPAHLMLAVWMGVGVTCLAELLPLEPSFVPSAWRGVVVVLFALVPLSAIGTNLPTVDRSQERGGYAWGQYALNQPLEAGGAIPADTKKFAPLYYLQQVEGVRPDLDVVLLGSEELYQADLQRRLGEGQTVYLARYLPHLEGLYLRSVGPLVEVGGPDLGAAPEVGGASGQVLARLGERVRLLDAEVEEDPLGRALYHVTLHWQAEAPVDDDLVVRLRLVDAKGQVQWTSEGQRPVNGLYPTNAWSPDIPIADYHDVPIEPWLPPGSYSLQVGLFSPFGNEQVESEASLDPWVSLGALQVSLPAGAEALPRRRLLSLGGEAWLTGVAVPEQGTADNPLTVELAWRSVAEDEEVRLWWGEDEGSAGSSAGAPAGDEHTYALLAGMVRSRHVITAPGEAGIQTLWAGLAGEPARCRWLASPGRSCRLARVRILAGQEALASFGDRVLLVEARVGLRQAQPGEVIPVDLRWRGLRTMGVDYTVFVHLVGPDGRLHGQVDSWPVQGTHPTSQWRPGKRVSDPYEVRLESDAPPGRYRVAVGLYELETMERLRVLDEAGKPVADFFTAGTFDVSE
jgi:hypothetical protein